MEKHTSCLICSSTKLVEKKGYEDYYLTQCSNCKFVFTSRIPTEQELIDFYQGYGRDDYLSPITIKRYNELLDEFEKYRNTNKLIDVGCGVGYFLDEAKKRGWEVYGTEYTDAAIEICEKKGIKMHKGVLNPTNYSVEFDVVTSFEVVEHINNPMEEFDNFNKLLREGGLLYVTTPNFNSWSRRSLKSKWSNICYPEHLSYYTASTLSKLLKEKSMIPIKVLTTGVSISRYKTSKGIEVQASISATSDDEHLRRKMDEKVFFRIAKKSLNTVLTFFRLGDALKIYAIKK